MNHTRRLPRLLVAVIGVAFTIPTLAACAAGTSATVNSSPSSSTSSEDTATTSDDTAPPAEDTSDDSSGDTSSGTAKLGGAGFSYEDGLVLLVSKPTVQSISQYAAGGKPGQKAIVVKVKLTNKTGEVFDANLVQVALTWGTDGNQAEDVFDSEKGLAGGLEGSIAKGKSKTATYGFAVPKKALGGPITVEVTPSFDHDASTFEGTAPKG